MTLLTLPEAKGSGLSERAKALVFEDPRSQDLLQEVQGVAGSESPVLLLGEVGTGRELVARYIHELSLRKLAPFHRHVINKCAVETLKVRDHKVSTLFLNLRMTARYGWIGNAKVGGGFSTDQNRSFNERENSAFQFSGDGCESWVHVPTFPVRLKMQVYASEYVRATVLLTGSLRTDLQLECLKGQEG